MQSVTPKRRRLFSVATPMCSLHGAGKSDAKKRRTPRKRPLMTTSLERLTPPAPAVTTSPRTRRAGWNDGGPDRLRAKLGAEEERHYTPARQPRVRRVSAPTRHTTSTGERRRSLPVRSARRNKVCVGKNLYIYRDELEASRWSDDSPVGSVDSSSDESGASDSSSEDDIVAGGKRRVGALVDAYETPQRRLGKRARRPSTSGRRRVSGSSADAESETGAESGSDGDTSATSLSADSDVEIESLPLDSVLRAVDARAEDFFASLPPPPGADRAASRARLRQGAALRAKSPKAPTPHRRPPTPRSGLMLDASLDEVLGLLSPEQRAAEALAARRRAAAPSSAVSLTPSSAAAPPPPPPPPPPAASAQPRSSVAPRGRLRRRPRASPAPSPPPPPPPPPETAQSASPAAEDASSTDADLTEADLTEPEMSGDEGRGGGSGAGGGEEAAARGAREEREGAEGAWAKESPAAEVKRERRRRSRFLRGSSAGTEGERAYETERRLYAVFCKRRAFLAAEERRGDTEFEKKRMKEQERQRRRTRDAADKARRREGRSLREAFAGARVVLRRGAAAEGGDDLRALCQRLAGAGAAAAAVPPGLEAGYGEVEAALNALARARGIEGSVYMDEDVPAPNISMDGDAARRGKREDAPAGVAAWRRAYASGLIVAPREAPIDRNPAEEAEEQPEEQPEAISVADFLAGGRRYATSVRGAAAGAPREGALAAGGR